MDFNDTPEEAASRVKPRMAKDNVPTQDELAGLMKSRSGQPLAKA